MPDFEQRTELLLASTCITYLAFEELRVHSRSLDRSSEFLKFFEYAKYYWFTHIRTSDETHEYRTRLEIILRSPNADHWISYEIKDKSISLWQIAIAHDIDWLADLLLNEMSENLYEAITEDCLVHCATLWRDSRVLERLLDHPKTNRMRVTEKVLLATGKSYSGYRRMKLLLEKRNNEVKITENVVQAIARNEDGFEMMKLLLHERGSEVKITEEVLKAIAGNLRGYEMMDLLLE